MRIALAPAKINLALHVTGQRGDGYHLIDSIVVFADTVAASDALIVSGAPRDGFDISGIFGDALEPVSDNLVLRARELVRANASTQGIDALPVHISLVKRLPIASGIGGGSADAAAALKLLHTHWDVSYNAQHTSPRVIAHELGADVPMCLLGKPARITGIGETIVRLSHIPLLHMVLVNCGMEISTPDIFSALENKENPALFDLPETDFVAWLKERTRNDLRKPAEKMCAGVGASLGALNAQGAIYAQMSGSGASCFGIFNTSRQATEAAQIIQKAEPTWWVVATHTAASA